jgi:hypothetical protein
MVIPGHRQTRNVKKAVFLVVAPCRSGVNRRFGGTYRLHLQGRLLTCLTDALRADFLIFPLYPEDGGDTFLRNVG